MSTDIRHTHRLALDRVEWVVRTLLPDELVSATPQSMEVPAAPADTECYLLAEQLGQQLLTTGLALVVESYAPSTISDYQSGSPTERRCRMAIPCRIRVLFSRLAQPVYTRPNTSRPCSFEEQLQLVAEVYKGALLAILFRDLPDSQIITDVVPTRDYAGVAPEGDAGFIGVALIECDLICEATIPGPRRHLQPGADL